MIVNKNKFIHAIVVYVIVYYIAVYVIDQHHRNVLHRHLQVYHRHLHYIHRLDNCYLLYHNLHNLHPDLYE